MSDYTIQYHTMFRIIAHRLIVLSPLLLTACAEKGWPEPDCTNQPALVSNCMAKEICGLEGADNVNYASCKLTCEARIKRQCRIERIEKVADRK